MYALLPFRFGRLDDCILAVTDAGEHHFLDARDFDEFVSGRLDARSPLFMDLKAKFFATDGDIAPAVGIQAIKYRTKRVALDQSLCLHMVVPTVRCNSRCVYCQVGSRPDPVSRPGTDMSIATARRVVDLIHQSPGKHFKIEFQGGEPLLNFEVVRFIVRYSRILSLRTRKEIEYVLCTNMTDVPDAALRFLKRHRVAISTSLDGPREIHDRQRPSAVVPSAFDAFRRNCRRARNVLGEEGISALLTVTDQNLDRLREVVDEYLAQGFRSIFIRPINPFGRAVTAGVATYAPGEFADRYTQALDYMVSLNLEGTSVREELACILLRRMLTPFGDAFVDLQSPAGAGLQCAVYNHDGNVYASDEGRMLGEMGDQTFLLGNVRRHSFRELFGGPMVRKLAADTVLEARPGCNACPYLPFCGSDPARDHVEAARAGRLAARPSNCALMKPVFEHLFRTIRADDRRTDVLWAWATGRTLRDVAL